MCKFPTLICIVKSRAAVVTDTHTWRAVLNLPSSAVYKTFIYMARESSLIPEGFVTSKNKQPVFSKPKTLIFFFSSLPTKIEVPGSK